MTATPFHAAPNTLPRAAFDADALLRAALRGERACGSFQIRIDREGGWHYRGSPIARLPLVKLFATVLRRAEDGSYWLITPGEQGRIEVDDVPFTAVELQSEGEGAGRQLRFRTNLEEWVPLDPGHPLRLAAHGDAAVPYLLVRDRLEARIARPVYYQLVELAEPHPEHTDLIGVWSGGRFWTLGSGDD
jgi:hypothetical protein